MTPPDVDRTPRVSRSSRSSRGNGAAPVRRTREDVVRTAGRLFAERGFHGTSMRDLGQELGLLGSSLYAHIGSKSELLVEIIREGAEQFQALADEVVAAAEPPECRLAALVRGHVAIITANLDRAATYLNEARHLPERERAEVLAWRDRYQEAFRLVLAEGARTGAFRPDLDIHLSATFILSLLNNLERWYRPDGAHRSDDVAEALVRFVLSGIGPSPLEVPGEGPTAASGRGSSERKNSQSRHSKSRSDR